MRSLLRQLGIGSKDSILNKLCGITNVYSISVRVLKQNGAGADYCAFANRYPRSNKRISRDPCPLLDLNGLGNQLKVGVTNVMRPRTKICPLRDNCLFRDAYATLAIAFCTRAQYGVRVHCEVWRKPDLS